MQFCKFPVLCYLVGMARVFDDWRHLQYNQLDGVHVNMGPINRPCHQQNRVLKLFYYYFLNI
jgi:hypothetical protein